MPRETSYYEVRAELRLFTKYAVALRAVALLEEGDSILIDAGTSLTPIAKIIRRLADDYPDQTHYTIMTHNQAAFNALSDTPPNARFNVFQTGGRYDRDLNASFGHQAEMAYLRYHPRWVFIGQNGLEADLGLFCHGNTEELALKREIFSMPAWGRVIISDFTKMGVPGGLLFGDSMNLTTNVDECWIITDDLHDEKFKENYPGDMRKRHQERFETQVRSLQETYQARIDATHYSVLRAQGKYDYERKEGFDLRFVKSLHHGIEDQSTTDSDAVDRWFRIMITRDDVTEEDPEKLDAKQNIYVDFSFAKSATSNKLDPLVHRVELHWDVQGKSILTRQLEASNREGRDKMERQRPIKGERA